MLNIKFSIILTRNEDPMNDEKIVIMPDMGDDDLYTISYNDLSIPKKWVINTDYAGVCRYFETLVNSLKYDIIDTYKDIQIHFPMYPILAIPVDVFCSNDFQKTIGEMFDSVMEMEFHNH